MGMWQAIAADHCLAHVSAGPLCGAIVSGLERRFMGLPGHGFSTISTILHPCLCGTSPDTASIMPIRHLTELEGTLLGAIEKRGPLTGYRLRRMFLDSPSLEWSGSAGAIYPAIRRLAKAGLLRAGRVRDARGGRRYGLTAKGEGVLTEWLCDVNRAASPGIDLFRGRAALCSTLPSARATGLMRSIVGVLKAQCAA